MKKTLFTILLLLPLTTQASLSLGSGLVGYYPMDSRDYSSISSIIDRSGNVNTGVLQNSPAKVAGKIGQALSFNGSNQDVSVADSSTLEPTAITVSAWVKGSAFTNGYNAIVQKGNGSAYFEYFVKNNGKLAVYLLLTGGGSSYDGSGTYTLSPNQWYNVAFTYNSTNGGVGYVNGLQDSTFGANGMLASTTGQMMYIGTDGFTAGRYFSGTIDDVRVYNRVLTPQEISQLYRQSASTHAGSFMDSVMNVVGGIL